MIEIKIGPENFDLNKFWKVFGGLGELVKIVGGVTSKQPFKTGEEIVIKIPQISFHGMPFRFDENNKLKHDA